MVHLHKSEPQGSNEWKKHAEPIDSTIRKKGRREKENNPISILKQSTAQQTSFLISISKQSALSFKVAETLFQIL